jgi:AbiU2
MTYYTPEEVEQRYITAMGQDLGTTFYQLFNEFATLNITWKEYVILFGTDESRVELLNKAASGFFRLVQDSLFENVLLHISRLTDGPKVGGGGGRETLTLQRLPTLVRPTIRSDIDSRLKALLDRAGFARDWRHRRLAHSDLRLALDEGATPLASASRRDVKETLEAIEGLLNAVETHYCETAPVSYDIAGHPGSAETLLHVLERGVEARATR